MESHGQILLVQQKKGVSKSKYGNEVNITHEDSYGSKTMVLIVEFSNECSYSKTWFLDTGYLNHMIGHWSLLIKFDDSRRSKIILANGISLQEKGVGNMVITRSNGKITIIEDVLYVSGMKCNLLSVDQLTEKGF